MSDSNPRLAMRVSQVLPDSGTDAQVIILRDTGNVEVLPIPAGYAEGNAVRFASEGITPPRPMTHDLLRDILKHMGVTVEDVVIEEIKNSTYYAKIHLVSGEERWAIDARPSDAIALALRTDGPIYVSESVLKNRDLGEMDLWLGHLRDKGLPNAD
jgi:uncharacterized protein